MRRRDFVIGGAILLGLGRAQAQILPGPGLPVVSGSSFTTLNPADKSANITLSGGNLIATASATGSVRSIASHSSGKFYCEMTAGVGGNSFDHAFGLANSTASLSGFPGTDTNSLVLYSGSANILYNNATLSPNGPVYNGTPTTSGDIVGMAVDIGGALVWYRVNGGVWNSSGTNNPATGVGGVAFTITGSLFVLAEGGVAAVVNTMNFGATSYANAAPAGFGNW